MSYDPGAPGDRSQPPGGYGGPGGPPPYGSGYGQQPPPGWGPPPGPGAPGGFPGGPVGPGGPPLQAEGKNFFAALFDYSFNSFATPGLIRVLYIIGTVVIALGWLGYTVVFFQFSAVFGLITLIFGAIVSLFILAFLRVSLEFYYAVVRMSEDIHNRR